MSEVDPKSPEVTVVSVPDIPELKDAVWKEDIFPSSGDCNAVRVKFLDPKDCPVETAIKEDLKLHPPGTVDDSKTIRKLCGFSHGEHVAVIAESDYGQLFFWKSSAPDVWVQLPFLPKLETRECVVQTTHGGILRHETHTERY